MMTIHSFPYYAIRVATVLGYRMEATILWLYCHPNVILDVAARLFIGWKMYATVQLMLQAHWPHIYLLYYVALLWDVIALRYVEQHRWCRGSCSSPRSPEIPLLIWKAENNMFYINLAFWSSAIFCNIGIIGCIHKEQCFKRAAALYVDCNPIMNTNKVAIMAISSLFFFSFFTLLDNVGYIWPRTVLKGSLPTPYTIM